MKYLDLNDAYVVQRRFADDTSNICGWKLGGTNKLTKDLFKVEELYFGFLREDQIFGIGYRPINELILNTFEVEICVKTPINYSHLKIYSEEEIQSWNAYLGLEFPQTRIANLPEKGVAHLIADNCAAGALFVSNTLFKLGRGTSITVRIDGIKVSEKIDLITEVSQIVGQFLEINKKHGFIIESGQMIATGGISKLLTLEKNQTISIKKDSKTILEFTR